jgi:DNA-directed RNA polymerase subunit RPC12/RpoP
MSEAEYTVTHVRCLECNSLLMVRLRPTLFRCLVCNSFFRMERKVMIAMLPEAQRTFSLGPVAQPAMEAVAIRT